jgi:hypothetical protein
MEGGSSRATTPIVTVSALARRSQNISFCRWARSLGGMVGKGDSMHPSRDLERLFLFRTLVAAEEPHERE